MRRRQLRARLRSLPLLLLRAFVLLCVAELVVRWIYAAEIQGIDAQRGTLSVRQGAQSTDLQGNPFLLWEMTPGPRQGWNHVKTYVNHLGMRGPEPEIPKPEGVRRLMVTGDSSVFGFGVKDEEVFVQRAAQQLGVEGWNAAVAGYSSYQTLNFLQMRALSLEPDVIVIGNIWADNSFDSFIDRELLESYSSLGNTARERLHNLLIESSSIWRILDHRQRIRTGPRAEARKIGWQLGSGPKPGQPMHRRVSIQEYAVNLDRLAQLTLEHGAEPAFLILANRQELELARDPQFAGATDRSWTPYRQVMRDTAARYGAPILSVPDLNLASGKSTRALFLDEMHPTATGHAMIADALIELLRPWAEEGESLLKDPQGGAIPEYQDHYSAD